MQFAHSGSQTERQPPPHPALPYDATAGAPHSAESVPSLGVAPRPRLFTPLHLRRSMAPCAYRPTAPYLRHTMLPSPTPLTVPHWAPRPPLGTAPELPEAWKQKVIKIATFLRLAIAADVQITNRTPKMKQNDRSVPHFHFTGDEKEPLIAKKLQKRQDFFFRKANCRNRSRFRNEPIAKRGQIPR